MTASERMWFNVGIAFGATTASFSLLLVFLWLLELQG